MEKRKFDLDVVLTVATGKLILQDFDKSSKINELLCDKSRNINYLWDLLEFMTGQTLFNIQLGTAMRCCQKHILDKFPQLRYLDTSTLTAENLQNWLADVSQSLNLPLYDGIEIEPIPPEEVVLEDVVNKFVETTLAKEKK